MHTQAQPGINMDVAKNLEESFTWVPPLVGQSDDNMAGPKAISLDEIDGIFAAFEQEASMKQQESISMGQGMLKGTVYSFYKLDRVDMGIVPWALDEVVEVVDHSQQDNGGWNAALLMSSSGLGCP